MGIAPRQAKKAIGILSGEERQKLDDLFYGGGLLMRRFQQFKDQAGPLHLPEEKLKFYYDNQELVQLFKPVIQPKYYIPISATYPMERVYFDTMVITPLNLTLINAVDLFSKYGWVKSFRGQSPSSEKSVLALKAIIDDGYMPSSIRVDDGTEFYGSFAKACKDVGINLIHLEPGDKKKTSPIEAFNRTVRLAVEKVRATLSSENPVQTQIEKAIKDIVYSYNHSIHSTTKASPYDVLHNKEVADEVLVRMALKKKERIDQVSNQTLPVGSHVRLAVTQNVFSKLSPNWTAEIFRVIKFDEGKNRYFVDSSKAGRKGYERWQLQPVDMDNLMTKKIRRWISERKADEIKTRSHKKVEKELHSDLVGAEPLYAKRERKGINRLDL